MVAKIRLSVDSNSPAPTFRKLCWLRYPYRWPIRTEGSEGSKERSNRLISKANWILSRLQYLRLTFRDLRFLCYLLL